MTLKTRKPPVSRRTFKSIWAELDYLCGKIRFWLYIRKQRAEAERYLGRLQRVLHDLPENGAAIIREEGLSLLHELKGDVGSAIAHRKREIRLMERLLKDAESHKYSNSTRAYLLRNRDVADLQERRAILETLRKHKTRQNNGMLREHR